MSESATRRTKGDAPLSTERKKGPEQAQEGGGGAAHVAVAAEIGADEAGVDGEGSEAVGGVASVEFAERTKMLASLDAP